MLNLYEVFLMSQLFFFIAYGEMKTKTKIYHSRKSHPCNQRKPMRKTVDGVYTIQMEG